jgi:hypothetical protein
MRILVAIHCFLLTTSIALAQPGLPPVFKTVAGADKEKGQILFTETVTRAVPVQREIAKEVIEIVNGMQVKKVVKVTVTEYVMEHVQQTVSHDAAKSRVITPDGKQLPIDEVWKRLKAKSIVLVSADGNTPSAEYLRMLRPEALIIMLPRVTDPPIVAPKLEPIPPPKKG